VGGGGGGGGGGGRKKSGGVGGGGLGGGGGGVGCWGGGGSRFIMQLPVNDAGDVLRLQPSLRSLGFFVEDGLGISLSVGRIGWDQGSQMEKGKNMKEKKWGMPIRCSQEPHTAGKKVPVARPNGEGIKS